MAIEQLGCAERYQVAVTAQGGGPVVTWVSGLTELTWGRKRDDYSEASITVAKRQATADCCGKLGDTHVWLHELAVYRDEDQEPVWAGPIIDKRENTTTFTFAARDMLFWLDRRGVEPVAPEYFTPNPIDTGAIIRQIVTDGFPLADILRNPGLLEYAVLEDTGTTSTTDHLWRHSVSIGDVVRELLDAGVDLYTVGRRIRAHSDRSTATPYRLTDDDFLADLEVRENGLDTATRGILVGGQPLDGNQQPIQNVAPIIGLAGGPEPGYGLIDRISTSQNTVHQSVADGIAGAIRGYGFPPPVDVIVPQGAQLAPHAPVSLGQLVPGRRFVVALSDQYCTSAEQVFRLNEVAVSWTSTEVEKVAVSLASEGTALEST
jgi:hypothetical protein